jgi:hypothetical protein
MMMAQQAEEAQRQLQQVEDELRDVKAAAAAAEQRNVELGQQLAAAQASAAGGAATVTPATSPVKAPGEAATPAGASDADQVRGMQRPASHVPEHASMCR